MLKKTFRLVHRAARENALQAVRCALEGWIVTLSEPTRSLEQNAAQWPYLHAFSEQLKWPVNGELVKMTPDEWKDVLTAAFLGETVRLAQGLNGGVVMIGARTSEFGRGQFSEWYEFLKATAALRSVVVYPDDVVDAPIADRKPAKRIAREAA